MDYQQILDIFPNWQRLTPTNLGCVFTQFMARKPR